ncbi:GNAT family N-acetyltransferase [Orbus wheelerorum]|uniref:GNAT family N-acetyltransferase n=1 Tax=Orbus wheelerorum TaxID=3074111 RepID=UPI00370D657A
MIRQYQSGDLDKIMSIWLTENERAHNFIDADFFINNFELVKSLIPMSTVYVQDLNGIKGFIGITDNYIAGLFVDSNFHHQGIGTALIQKAKQKHNDLSVHVYQKNDKAVAFYLSQGFEVISESINDETNEIEYLMSCHLEHHVKIGKCAL